MNCNIEEKTDYIHVSSSSEQKVSSQEIFMLCISCIWFQHVYHSISDCNISFHRRDNMNWICSHKQSINAFLAFLKLEPGQTNNLGDQGYGWRLLLTIVKNSCETFACNIQRFWIYDFSCHGIWPQEFHQGYQYHHLETKIELSWT